jgi:hypothetical protein
MSMIGIGADGSACARTLEAVTQVGERGLGDMDSAHTQVHMVGMALPQTVSKSSQLPKLTLGDNIFSSAVLSLWNMYIGGLAQDIDLAATTYTSLGDSINEKLSSSSAYLYTSGENLVRVIEGLKENSLATDCISAEGNISCTRVANPYTLTDGDNQAALSSLNGTGALSQHVASRVDNSLHSFASTIIATANETSFIANPIHNVLSYRTLVSPDIVEAIAEFPLRGSALQLFAGVEEAKGDIVLITPEGKEYRLKKVQEPVPVVIGAKAESTNLESFIQLCLRAFDRAAQSIINMFSDLSSNIPSHALKAKAAADETAPLMRGEEETVVAPDENNVLKKKDDATIITDTAWNQDEWLKSKDK